MYKCGDFIDLCRGPHIHSSRAIASIKLTSASFVESEDSEYDVQLCLVNRSHYRFYGNSFISASAAKYYDKMMREAKDRDHRILGKKLELFLFDPNSPGNVFFLDRGLFVYNQLTKHLRHRYLRNYQEIASPLIFKSSLWRQSGHYDHYRENMFAIHSKSEVGELTLHPIGIISEAHELPFSLSRLF